MSTKVISAKIPTEEYDRLIEKCNEKGCSISDYVRERCLAEFAEPENIEQKQEDAELIKKNKLLEDELGVVKYRVDKLQKENDEFNRLFTSQEIVDRKIHRSADRMNFGCGKL